MSNPRAAQLVEAGMWLRLSGDHEGAKRLFDQALKLDPDNARARELLAAGNAPPAAPTAPSAPVPAPKPSPENPFAPAPTTTAMDLDWGSATGFAPTPVPFIPPVEARPPPPGVATPQSPVMPAAPVVSDEAELPVELDIESVPPPVFGDDAPSSTLVFGGAGAEEFPAPAPTAPESWAQQPQPSSPTMMFSSPGGQPGPVPGPVTSSATMMFSAPSGAGAPLPADDLPWGAPPEPAPAGGTMQFARPSEPLEAQAAATSGGTMQFPQPGALTPIPPGPASGGGTMQFARPPGPIASPIPPVEPVGTGTMQFARGEIAPESTGTMQFAAPQATLPEDSWAVMSSPSSVFLMPPSPVPEPPLPPPPSEPKFAPNATSAWDQRSNPGIKLSEISAGLGAALDLVSADRPHVTPPPQKSKLDEVRTLVRGAKDLLGLDDHTGAMDLILKAQELAPNDPEVQALRTRSEATLEAMFESKIGKLSAAPRVKLKDDEIIWLNLDHRAGFVLAQIDGSCTFEDLFSVSGMSRLDTARILAQLIEEGVITA